ncbi:T9SS type A sorting domain-containing protein [Ferruginibacter sp.]
MNTINLRSGSVALLLLLCCKTNAQVSFNIPANAAAGNISRIEYSIDADPGFGSSNTIAFTASPDVTVTNTPISLTGLSNGAHRLYLRSRNVNGGWSHTNISTFFIANLNTALPANSSLSNIVRMEYFIDTEPGFGNGINIPFSASTDVTVSGFAVVTTGLTNGMHQLYTRSKDSYGNWSHTNSKSFFIVNLSTTFPANSVPGNITQVEYFVDTDPGFGNGTTISFAAANDVTLNNYPITIGTLSNGAHRLYIRSKDAAGKWGHTNVQSFVITNNITIPSNPAPGVISKLEYFVDTDPGFGNGTTVNVTPTGDLNNYSFAANIGTLASGDHVFYIRSFDTWGLTYVYPFTVNGTLPLHLLSFNGQKQNAIVKLNWQTTNEINTKYFDVERSIDGVHFAAIGQVAAQTGTASIKDYSFDDKNFPTGVLYYRLKMVDINAAFSYSPIIRINNTASMVLSIYPNPANDIVTVALPAGTGKNIAINITNMQGQLVKQLLQASAPQIQLDVTTLPAGMYTVFITDGVNNYTQKITITH